MKKIIVIVVLFAFSVNIISAQNIIPNGSFETYTACPVSINSGSPDEVAKATGWYRIKQTPDYFNSCASSTVVGIPSNFFGFQTPASGNAYMGLWAYDSGTSNFREFIAAKLTNTLSIGQKYFLKITISNAEGYDSNCGIDKVGMRFSSVKHLTSAPPPINNFAHLYFNTIMADTLNWKYVFKSFIADSNYQYIEIGNFFNDLNTNFQILKPRTANLAYYYIDDVALSTDSLEALNFNANSTEVLELTNETKFTFYPNPTSNFIYSNKNLNIYTLSIKNIFGEQIDCFTQNDTSINFEKVPNGIYYLSIFHQSTLIKTEKIIIIKQ